MNVIIHSDNTCRSGRFRKYVARKVRDTIKPFRGKIQRVSVSLSDINGSRGGVDKQCRIEMRTTRGKVIRIHDAASDCASALSQAAHRCGASLKKLMGRERRRRTRGLGRASADGTFQEDI